MAAEAKLKWNIDNKTLDKMIEQVQRAGKEAGMTQAEIDKMSASLKNLDTTGSPALNKLNGGFNGLGGTVNKIGGYLAAAFAVNKLMEYGKAIITVTAQFQKFEAVLATALGSKSDAMLAMAQIQQFAASTPFSVQQLTDSYVKLVNRGIQPTNDQLRKMGDFAASAGKDIDQLVEAILDVNNQERWKEFGLKIITNGSKIQATFRGMSVEAERTEVGAMKLIEAFGGMEGITGSMAAVSETLGGKISNLGDSFDQLFTTLGNASDGPLQTVLDVLIDITNKVVELIEDPLSKTNKAAANVFETMRTEMDKMTNSQQIEKVAALRLENEELLKSFDDLAEELAAVNNAQKPWYQTLGETLGLTKGNKDVTKELEGEMEKARVQYIANTMAINKFSKAQEKVIDDTKKISQFNYLMNVTKTMRETRKQMFDDAVKDYQDLQDAIAFAISFDQEPMSIADNKILQQNEELVEAIKKGWESLTEFQANTRLQLLGGIASINDELFTTNQEARDREMAALQEQYDRDIEMAGENEKQKQRIRERFNDDRKKLMNEEAAARARMFVFEKLIALGEIFIKTRLAVAQAIAASPLTFGEPFASYARIQGGISAGIVGAQTLAALPRFKDGVYKLKGPGTRTSDSIMAMLSKDESVVPGAQSERFGHILRPMIENPNFSEMDLLKLTMKKMPMELLGNAWGNTHGVDSKKLEEKLDKLDRTIRNKPTANVYIDSNGPTLSVRHGNNQLNYIEERFGVRIK